MNIYSSVCLFACLVMVQYKFKTFIFPLFSRFIAIRYPLRARSLCTKRHARLVIVTVWLLSLLAAVPIIIAIVSM